MDARSLDIEEIKKYEQIRSPLLMVDYVTEVVPGEYAIGYKDFKEDEWFFPIHFPGEPNVPGAFLLEAAAQMLTIAITTLPDLAGKTTRFVSFDMKCKREVLPGERLTIRADVISWKRGVGKGKGIGYVGDEIACEANMTIVIPDVLNQFKPKV